MKKVFSVALLLLVSLISACAGVWHPNEQTAQSHMTKAEEQSSSQVVTSLDAPYLGGTPVMRQKKQFPGLNGQITLRRTGTLDEMCAALAGVLPDMKLRVDHGIQDEGKTPRQTPFSVNFQGELHQLLDLMAAKSGSEWDCDSDGVTFSLFQTRTFIIYASLGQVNYDNTITSKSREASGTDVIGGSSTGDSSSESQTAQTNRERVQFDTLKEVETAVKDMLSPAGSVSSNRAASSITVSDTPAVIRRVAKMVDDYNQRLSRQVSLTVRVWQVEINEDSSAGVDISPSITSGNLSIGGIPLNLGTSGFSATLIDGSGRGSKALIDALHSSGKATLLKASSGITMNNQPMPIQIVKNKTILARVSRDTSEYSESTTIEPGDLTYGFSVTLIPLILDRRRLILQYNLAISSLDAMEEFTTDDIKVQLPELSSKSFRQRVHMQMGQSLVLAGFQTDDMSTDGSAGLLSFGTSRQHERTLIVITIDAESIGEPLVETAEYGAAA